MFRRKEYLCPRRDLLVRVDNAELDGPIAWTDSFHLLWALVSYPNPLASGG